MVGYSTKTEGNRISEACLQYSSNALTHNIVSIARAADLNREMLSHRRSGNLGDS